MRMRKDCLAGMLVCKRKGWVVPCNKKNDKPIGVLGLGNFIFTGQFFISNIKAKISRFGQLNKLLKIKKI